MSGGFELPFQERLFLKCSSKLQYSTKKRVFSQIYNACEDSETNLLQNLIGGDIIVTNWLFASGI